MLKYKFEAIATAFFKIVWTYTYVRKATEAEQRGESTERFRENNPSLIISSFVGKEDRKTNSFTARKSFISCSNLETLKSPKVPFASLF